MQIFVNDTLVVNHASFDTNHFVFEKLVSWPSQIKIVVSNKNLSCDTQVDEQGKIVADKYIELKKVLVDRVESSIAYLNSPILDTGDNKINSCYWGFNGVVNLNFDQTDSFIWHLNQRSNPDKSYVVINTRI